MQAVFQTNELVENILVHLPAKTIFGVHRVIKSFRNAVKKSLPIKEKPFLRQRSEPLRTVMAWGVQHTASALNPLFVPGALYSNEHVLNKCLAECEDEYEKYAVKMRRECRISMKASLLDTYLLDTPFRRLELSLRFWVGEGGPSIITDNANVGAGKAMSIRDMIRRVVGSVQELGIAFDEDRYRKDSARDLQVHLYTSGRTSVETRGARKMRRLVVSQRQAINKLNLSQIVPHLTAAKSAPIPNRWRCEIDTKPSVLFERLQVTAGRPKPRVYVSLGQHPAFLLHDVVIPSPEDWAKIESLSVTIFSLAERLWDTFRPVETS
jgi:hypothetical protein